MCGGVGFKTRNLSEGELEKFYTPDQIRAVKKAGHAQQFFWNKQAFLPIETKTGVQLKLWGNKDDYLGIPKTAWAKIESIKAGKWDYLHPKPVILAIDAGLEKKLWFDLPEGAKGLMITKDGQDRVYLVTEEASPEYLAKTGHYRQPRGKIVYKKASNK